MASLEIALFDFADGSPRLIGRSQDPETIKVVREHLATEKRAQLARLEPPVRLLTDEDGGE